MFESRVRGLWTDLDASQERASLLQVYSYICGEQGISLRFPTHTRALCEVKCLPSWYDSQAD